LFPITKFSFDIFIFWAYSNADSTRALELSILKPQEQVIQKSGEGKRKKGSEKI